MDAEEIKTQVDAAIQEHNKNVRALLRAVRDNWEELPQAVRDAYSRVDSGLAKLYRIGI